MTRNRKISNLGSIGINSKTKIKKYKGGGALVTKRELANKSKIKTMQDAIELNNTLLRNIKIYIKDVKTQNVMTKFFNINLKELITRGKKIHQFYEKLSSEEHIKSLMGGILTTMVEDYFSSISRINDHIIKGNLKNMSDLVLLKQTIEKEGNYFQKAMLFNLVYEGVLKIENQQATIKQLEEIIKKIKNC